MITIIPRRGGELHISLFDLEFLRVAPDGISNMRQLFGLYSGTFNSTRKLSE